MPILKAGVLYFALVVGAAIDAVPSYWSTKLKA
jgi:hypothetical protein